MTEDTKVVNIQEELRKQVALMRETVAPPAGNVISLKGKQFTLPDGRQDKGPLNVIILDHVSANSYYTGAYNPKELTSPECFAVGRNVAEMVPSKNVTTPQHANCRDCPMNQWESATNGGKGKACKNTRRLLVIPEGTIDPEAQQYILNVSPSGIRFYDKYIDKLAGMGRHPIEFITEISFDPQETYPSLRFKAAEENSDVNLAWGLRSSGETLLLQEPNAPDKS
jgi:hypothetical protein